MKPKQIARSLRVPSLPPISTYFTLAMSVVLALADFASIYEMANMAFDTEGPVGIFVALSVTAGTIVVPLLAGKCLREHLQKRGEGERANLWMAVGLIATFLLVVAGVTVFRIEIENVRSKLYTTDITSAFGNANTSSVGHGSAVAKAILLLVLMLTTGIVSFVRALRSDGGDRDVVAARKAIRKLEAMWEMQGELAAQAVMDEEHELEEREREAVDALTHARVRLARDLISIATIVDPSQAEAVERRLAELDEEAKYPTATGEPKVSLGGVSQGSMRVV